MSKMEDRIELSDGTVTLRRYREEDAEPVYRAVRESIREISPWMPWCHYGYSLDDSKTWSASRYDAWIKGEEYDFIIISNNGGFPLGVCGLNHFDKENRFANVGYWVRTSKTNQGVATSAVRLLTRFSFDDLKLNRIEIVVSTENKPSQRVAEKAGAKQEGILRKRQVVRNRVYDAVMYSMIPEDVS
jgi:RimJ/RimL family protein N-acetyltransferase